MERLSFVRKDVRRMIDITSASQVMERKTMMCAKFFSTFSSNRSMCLCVLVTVVKRSAWCTTVRKVRGSNRSVGVPFFGFFS